MCSAKIQIDTRKVEDNSRVIAELCAAQGVEVAGVTKAVCGLPEVAQAMLNGGVASIGESRLDHVVRLQRNHVLAPKMMLRLPSLSNAQDVVALTDISLNSELETIRALATHAREQGKIHDIVIMLELGDLREGIRPADLLPICEEVVEFDGVRIVGLGTNLMCFSGILPSDKNMGLLVDCAELLESRLAVDLQYLSAGNSSALPMLAAKKMPDAINHLRIGFSILLGRNAVNDAPWPGCHQDVFRLDAELIESKLKPTLPHGVAGIDAFGNKPVFEDKGERTRGIAGVGRSDVNIGGLQPLDDRIEVLGGSSDHLVLDISDADPMPKVGEAVSFGLEYSALVPAMISPYVEKHLVS